MRAGLVEHVMKVIPIGAAALALSLSALAPAHAAKFSSLYVFGDSLVDAGNLDAALGNEWAKHNITVNGIAPGYFPSDITARYIDTEAFRQTLETYCPFGRPGRTGEMDGIAIYFASDASSYTTGQVVSVDGGWLTV